MARGPNLGNIQNQLGRVKRQNVRQVQRQRVGGGATAKDIEADPFLTDEEKAMFMSELQGMNRPTALQFASADLMGRSSQGLRQTGTGDIRTRIADLTRSRKQQANLKDLRNRLTQVSGFAGIQQRRTAATRQLSPGQDNASRKGTSLITSRS